METKKLDSSLIIEYVQLQLEYLENEISVNDRNTPFLKGMKHAYRNILEDFENKEEI